MLFIALRSMAPYYRQTGCSNLNGVVVECIKEVFSLVGVCVCLCVFSSELWRECGFWANFAITDQGLIMQIQIQSSYC